MTEWQKLRFAVGVTLLVIVEMVTFHVWVVPWLRAETHEHRCTCVEEGP